MIEEFLQSVLSMSLEGAGVTGLALLVVVLAASFRR
jgi:hypothetical protein